MQIKVKILLLFILLVSGNSSFAGNEKGSKDPAPRFTENKGQWNKNILYRLGLSNAHLYLEKNRFTWVFYDPQYLESIHHHGALHDTNANNAFAYHVNFLNADPGVKAFADYAHADYSNYFLGSDQKRWASHVRSYSEVYYDNLYQGIDMTIYAKNGLLKYDFLLEKGVAASQIKMEYEGVKSISIEGGNLMVVNDFNTVTEHKPIAWQLNGTKKIFVACRFVLTGNTVSFSFPEGYNTALELVIDPQIEFSTYTGSAVDNWGYTATYNSEGNLFAGGIAFGDGYPTTTGAYQLTFGGGIPDIYLDGTDISITKFSVDGSSLIYSTYIGGTSNELPYSMIVNDNDELFIFGSTGSADYPTTTGAYDQSYNGGTSTSLDGGTIGYTTGSDIFISRLSADGTSMIAGTLIGGTANDGLNEVMPLNYNYADHARGEIILDSAGNPIIASCTFSADFPTTPGVFQQTLNGNQDGCVFKMDAGLTTLIWSTFLGGSSHDAAYSVKLDHAGKLFTCGGTASSNFPVTSGTLNQTYQGGISDGFVCSFNALTGTLVNSSFFGTSAYDQSYFVEIDGDNDVYIYGQTLGTYPVTNGVYSAPNTKQFIHKFTNDIGTTYFSTVFGAGTTSLNISPTAFLVDVCEKIYIAGWGGTINLQGLGSQSYANVGNTFGMQVSFDAYQPATDGSDFYFMVLDENATSFLYGTFFGGVNISEHVDGGTSRFNKSGVIYEAVCAGCSGSDMFPTTPGAWSNTNNSTNCNEGAIKFRIELSEVDVDAKLDNNSPSPTGCAPFTVGFVANDVNTQGIFWDFGDGTTSTLENPTHLYTDTGIYTVMLVGYDSTTCTGIAFLDTSYITIAVLDGNSTNAGNETSLCSGDSAQLGAAPVAGLSYQWTPSLGLSNAAIANPLASPAATTTYILQAGIPGCSGSDTVTVTVVEKDPTTFTVDLTPACEGVHANFTNTTADAVQYFWDFGGEGTSEEANPGHNYDFFDNSDTITLITINTLGCADTLRFDTSGISVINIFPDSIPNIFTPNNDGLNECFITGIGNAYDGCFSMIIYNRWGRKVFETDKSSDCWDGLINDKRTADEGTYFYIIRIRDEEYRSFFQLKK